MCFYLCEGKDRGVGRGDGYEFRRDGQTQGVCDVCAGEVEGGGGEVDADVAVDGSPAGPELKQQVAGWSSITAA